MATLKVRVRAASGGPTLRVQLQQPCTLQALKDAIALQIEKSASSFEISLNKKDPISGPPDLLLSAFGVINGDLVFYIPSTGSSVSVSCLTSHRAQLLYSSSVCFDELLWSRVGWCL